MLELEAVPGGSLVFRYEEAGSRDHPEWRSRMEAAGLSTSWSARGTFTELVPPRRIAFRQQLDFGRSARPLEYRLSAELTPEGRGTTVALVAASEPTRHWRLLGEANLRGQLDRLERAAAAGARSPTADR